VIVLNIDHFKNTQNTMITASCKCFTNHGISPFKTMLAAST